MTPPCRIGVAGFGVRGAELARNVAEAQGCELTAVCDSDDRRLAAIAAERGLPACESVEALLGRHDVDAVIVASPAPQHHAHARDALFAGKHVLVDEPLALRAAHCEDLAGLAAARGLALMTGHSALYSRPVRAVHELVRTGSLGRVLYCHSQRLEPGAGDALWQLAPRDVSLLIHLLGEPPRMVSAQQFTLRGPRTADMALVTMVFHAGVVGQLHLSRVDAGGAQRFTVVGDRKTATYDEADPSAPLRVQETGAGLAVALDTGGPDPQRAQVEHFAECIRDGGRPLTDGRHGRDVVAALEAAERSSVLGGEPHVVRALDAAAAA